jgi:hypothetical protein
MASVDSRLIDTSQMAREGSAIFIRSQQVRDPFIKPSYKKSRAICTLSCECHGFSLPPTCPRHHDETFGFQVPHTDAHMAFVASHNGGSGEEGGCGSLRGGPYAR